MIRHDAASTAALLPYPALAASIAEFLHLRAAGRLELPERTATPLDAGGTLLTMPAVGAGLAITKLVTVHPDNAAQRLPTIQGEVVVMRSGDGVRLGMLDGAVVTGRRTAALSLLAAGTLAPGNTGPLLIVGTGTQARSHLDAFREGRGVSEVVIAARTPANGEALASHARGLGMRARVVADPREAAADARLIVTATTSREPVVDWQLEPGTFVCAVGAFRPVMAELAPATVASAATVVVDTLEGARAEAGDLIQAAAAGAFAWDSARELQEMLGAPRETPGVSREGMPPAHAAAGGAVIFKSVGHAIYDLAAARLAFSDQTGPHVS